MDGSSLPFIRDLTKWQQRQQREREEFLWGKGHAQLTFSQIRRSSSSSWRLDFSSFGAVTQREKNGRFLLQNEGKILSYIEGINAAAYSWQDLIMYPAFYSLAKFQGHFGWSQIFRAKLDRVQGLWLMTTEEDWAALLFCWEASGRNSKLVAGIKFFDLCFLIWFASQVCSTRARNV